MKLKLLALGLFALTAAAVAYYPNVSAPIPVEPVTAEHTIPDGTPKIEVVFVLDTTGSMGGLIDAAKEKIWSIASTMSSAQPAPEIKMGLVAYRDRGDAYVTRVIDLSDDLDSMYATLMDFQADGGGDGPESVNEALHDAINDISWSQDPDSYQVVFLVGDAPPHMDYQDDVKYPVTLAEANRRGIVVNTIRCGNDPNTENAWQLIAAATQGNYFTVGQAGSAIAMTTPFDAALAKLSAELDDTRLFYGTVEEKVVTAKKVEATDELHERASESAKARRAAFNLTKAGKANQFGDRDLVAGVVSGDVELDAVPEAELPAAMQSMAPEAREGYVKEKQARRDELTRQMKDLADQRAAYLAAKVGESEDKEESLDHKLFDTVREQAAKKGMSYAEAPAY